MLRLFACCKTNTIAPDIRPPREFTYAVETAPNEIAQCIFKTFIFNDALRNEDKTINQIIKTNIIFSPHVKRNAINIYSYIQQKVVALQTKAIDLQKTEGIKINLDNPSKDEKSPLWLKNTMSYELHYYIAFQAHDRDTTLPQLLSYIKKLLVPSKHIKFLQEKSKQYMEFTGEAYANTQLSDYETARKQLQYTRLAIKLIRTEISHIQIIKDREIKNIPIQPAETKTEAKEERRYLDEFIERRPDINIMPPPEPSKENEAPPTPVLLKLPSQEERARRFATPSTSPLPMSPSSIRKAW